MGRPKKVDMYQANESCVTTFDGEQVSIQKGDLLRAGHPMLKGREWLFLPATDYVRFDLEQATAAPGETRGGDDDDDPKTTTKGK